MSTLLSEEELTDYFEVYRTSPELSMNIPPQYIGEAWNIRIDIAAAGGGRVGEAYACNSWIYSVYVDGELVMSGADLHSGAFPATHFMMVASLCGFIAYDTEDQYPETIAQYGDRLTLFTMDARDY